VVRVDHDPGSAPTNALPDQLVIGAKDDHDPLKTGAAGGGNDVLKQRAALEGQELLWRAHPLRRAGCEHDPRLYHWSFSFPNRRRARRPGGGK
jgi:hypothetical protein